ncbi:MAG: hypothetical protein ABJ275_03960 [Maricaulaceae bacterium]
MTKIILSIAGATLLACCASTPSIGSNEFSIATLPAGALVTTTLETPKSVSAREHDESLPMETYGCLASPCRFTVPKRSTFIVRVEKEGFKTARIIARSETNPPKDQSQLITNATLITAADYVEKSGDDAIYSDSLNQASTSSADIAKTLATAVLIGPIGAFALSGSGLRLYPNPVYLELEPVED